MDSIRILLFPLHIKQRLILGGIMSLLTLSLGIAVAMLTTDHSVILNESMRIEDAIRVIKNGG